MSNLIITVIIILVGSAFFSCVEAAIFSVPINKVKILSDKNVKAKKLLKIKENIKPTITVLVVFTNIFNIAGSSYFGLLVAKNFENPQIGLFSAILTFLVIIFAEIIPKTVGDLFSLPISLQASPFLLFMTGLLKPFILVIEKMTSFFPKKNSKVTESEIKKLSDLSHSEGMIEKDEKEMIERIFLLNDLRAKDIMTPRTVINALPSQKKLKEIEEDIYKMTHSRIPIYKDNLDNVIGICHSRDMLTNLSKGKKDLKIDSLMNPEVITVSENEKIDNLIPLFQKKRVHIAIVKDEFGGTSGVVSLEDVLEQLIGDIFDEFDEDINLREKAKKISEKNSNKK